MATTKIASHVSSLRFGLARVDITPTVGIYHGFWGASKHHASTGIHRPLKAYIMAFGPADHTSISLIRAQLDLIGLVKDQHEELVQSLSEAGRMVGRDSVLVTYSHTHSSGWFSPDRLDLPGGDLIIPYLGQLRKTLVEACGTAEKGMQEVLITYAAGRCSLAANRDYWDQDRSKYACGFNPDGPADDTILVARITDLSGRIVGTIVNYACHPTTLGWQNALISPDYVGAMREELEKATGAPCVFLLGACGELGPRDGFTGDTEVADRNGRQLAYAALSVLESMGPPATEMEYQGPVISGATLGTWTHIPISQERLRKVSRFQGGKYSVDLPLKPKPDAGTLKSEMEKWLFQKQAAEARGDLLLARDCGAYAERARRWLARLKDLPEGKTYPLSYSAHRMGDAIWVTCGGEPYSIVQTELRRRFPELTILFSPLAGDLQVAYLLPADRYGKGLYQEEPSILAPGCLERLIDGIAARIKELS